MFLTILLSFCPQSISRRRTRDWDSRWPSKDSCRSDILPRYCSLSTIRCSPSGMSEPYLLFITLFAMIRDIWAETDITVNIINQFKKSSSTLVMDENKWGIVEYVANKITFIGRVKQRDCECDKKMTVLNLILFFVVLMAGVYGLTRCTVLCSKSIRTVTYSYAFRVSSF